jgi:hypothetical protein
MQVLQLRDATSQTGVSPPQLAPQAMESPVGTMASPRSGVTIEGGPLPATSPVSALVLAVDASGLRDTACRSTAQPHSQTLDQSSRAQGPHRSVTRRGRKVDVEV